MSPSSDSFGALSTIITTPNNPSALLQLASFAALHRVAEEEELDWGSTGSTASMKSKKTQPPAGASDSVPQHLSVKATTHRHRRQNRQKGGGSTTGSSCGPSSEEASVQLDRPGVHDYSMWTQLHVMEVACSTRSNNFVHITERFVQYHNLYPTVYKCHLNKVSPPAAAEDASGSGRYASRSWACQNCGFKHHAVRECCDRCRIPGPYVKLFFGQVMKEENCCPSLGQFLRAAFPDTVIHRMEPHLNHTAEGDGRCKGCAAVYVYRDAAPEMINKLNGNAFLDVDDVTGELLVYYVYTSQRRWLNELIKVRTAQPGRSVTLPGGALVVEEAKTMSRLRTRRRSSEAVRA
ncbi:hypothetical protein AGDE_03700 [Angomonas deanei]|nr:hypothetical protein AGDE_03700 [Angomonas deanei]|eukprot:EPY40228.1 hypothetical protein AGDE_03700 [Angomonas deanei]